MRFRLGELVRGLRGGGHEHGRGRRRPARTSTRARWSRTPRPPTTLRPLREAGIAIGVCSNWGWELDAYLEQVGLLGSGRLDASRRRGPVRASRTRASTPARPRRSGSSPTQAVFVGDSWEPDVRGPRRLGMTAVHVWRADERDGQDRAGARTRRPPRRRADAACPSPIVGRQLTRADGADGRSRPIPPPASRGRRRSRARNGPSRAVERAPPDRLVASPRLGAQADLGHLAGCRLRQRRGDADVAGDPLRPEVGLGQQPGREASRRRTVGPAPSRAPP